MLADVTVLTTLSRGRVQRELRRGGQIRADRRCALLRLARGEQRRNLFRLGPGAQAGGGNERPRKALIVAEDEREESGRRALLNLGHTFGHALEAYAGCLPTGSCMAAIAIGMRLAASTIRPSVDFAPRAMRPGSPSTSPVAACSRRANPWTARPAPDALLRLMAQDKKVKAAGSLVLARGVGQVFVERDVSMPQLTEFVAACA